MKGTVVLILLSISLGATVIFMTIVLGAHNLASPDLTLTDISAPMVSLSLLTCTVELQWLEHLWDHENMFETGVIRANEG